MLNHGYIASVDLLHPEGFEQQDSGPQLFV